ncbi:hypothetical protein [Sulfitobacter aestuariivivens]|uniref:DUF4886 domain-containing protein n=1 Tax=Sulfitobacter aestuariivivens TaxID=2766981 RepID=A0A927D115_9RHOB|nr:hypothetical protein [Sulfitobacter aestuariivivens]MBD3662398.1 hypothetical protein [Sulfitobacter aestuariivivens]
MQISRRMTLAGLALGGAGAAYWWRNRLPEGVPNHAVSAHFETPLTPPAAPLSVYHLGHSLVGRDMPAMLAQLAGHPYNSQLGWGTSLRDHWEPDVPINGFDVENDHPRFRPAKEALGSGRYDAVVLTEMVEIRDAIQYHASPEYLVRWAALARAANPDTRLYLYETWHHTDDGNGWLTRIDRDLEAYWQELVKNPAITQLGAPVYLIPAGQAMAAVVRTVSDGKDPDMLFSRHADGSSDTIHFNDLGAYVVALTHYAVLYHRSPLGVPHDLERADGTRAEGLDAALARQMQQVVWDVVTRHPETGVAV